MALEVAKIKGVSEFCLYGPKLQEALGEQLLTLAGVEDAAQKMGAMPYMDVPTDLINELESYLAENPCKFVVDGICPVAIFTGLKAAGKI